jgi:hypothetical protein
MIDPDRIQATPKRERSRLAKAELWMAVACSHAVSDPGKDIDERGRSIHDPTYLAPEGEIMLRYGLAPADIQRIMQQIGDELENRAMRAGYEDAWL